MYNFAKRYLELNKIYQDMSKNVLECKVKVRVIVNFLNRQGLQSANGEPYTYQKVYNCIRGLTTDANVVKAINKYNKLASKW